MHASNDRSKDIEDSCLSALLLAWYTVEKRDLPWRKTENPYLIWISEVMLQQTQVKTVIPYYERFLQRFPSVGQLARASLEEVLTIWSGLGYYSRARRMWEGAHYICDQCEGKMPEGFDALIRIPGIGDYTAGAIASIAFGQRVVAIDGNVKRVVSRLLAWPEAVETARTYRHFKDHLTVWQPVLQPGDFNQALMELGAMVCTPTKPDCGRCPLAQVCEGYRRDEVLLYPVKKPKTQRQVVTRLTFVLRRGSQVYLQRRPSQGLLADLWEFPGVELSEDNSAKDSLPVVTDGECFNLYQTAVPERAFEGQVREQFEQGVTLHGPIWYTFSHRRWKLVWAIVDLPDLIDQLNVPGLSESLETESAGSSLVRELEVEYQPNPRGVQQLEDNWCWVQLQDLSRIPLPVAFRTIVEDLTKLV